METAVAEYYTPDLSELYLGFEFEINKHCIPIPGSDGWEEMTGATSADWVKCVYGNKTMFLLAYNERETAIICRVKHLDREDIESLGWEHDQTTKDGAVFYKGTMMDEHHWCLTAYNAILRKGNDYTQISISDINDKLNLGNSFSGVIKNISELRRLQKQLGIK